MEFYWSFARFIVSKNLNIGSPKIGSFSDTLIIPKISALANGAREGRKGCDEVWIAIRFALVFFILQCKLCIVYGLLGWLVIV